MDFYAKVSLISIISLFVTGFLSSSCHMHWFNHIAASNTATDDDKIRSHLTLWHWPLTSWTWSHVTWCYLGGQHLCQAWGGYDLTVPELGPLQFSTDCQLKVPTFTFLGVKRGQISNLIFLGPKRHYLGKNDVWWRIAPVAVSKDATRGRDEGKRKKDRNFYASNWTFAHTTNVYIAPWNFACGAVFCR